MKRIRSISLRQLGLPPETLKRVSNLLARHVSGNNLSAEEYNKEVKRISSNATVEDVIAFCGTGRREYGVVSVSMIKRVYGVVIGAVMMRLVELGATYLDWDLLPLSTLSPDAVKGLRTEILRRQRVLVLRTLSNIALDYLSKHLGKEPYQITISDLLNTDGTDWYLSSKTSIEMTREKLLDLGFRYDDGPFLQVGTRRRFMQSLINEEKLTRKTARLIVRIAEKRNWVGPFLPEL